MLIVHNNNILYHKKKIEKDFVQKGRMEKDEKDDEGKRDEWRWLDYIQKMLYQNHIMY